MTHRLSTGDVMGPALTNLG